MTIEWSSIVHRVEADMDLQGDLDVAEADIQLTELERKAADEAMRDMEYVLKQGFASEDHAVQTLIAVLQKMQKAVQPVQPRPLAERIMIRLRSSIVKAARRLKSRLSW